MAELERTPEQRDAVMESWQRAAQAEGWEVDADTIYWAAVDGLAWSLIEQAMDTADREPSPDSVAEARATAERMLASRPTSPAKLTEEERETLVEALQVADDSVDARYCRHVLEVIAPTVERILAARTPTATGDAGIIRAAVEAWWLDVDGVSLDHAASQGLRRAKNLRAALGATATGDDLHDRVTELDVRSLAETVVKAALTLAEWNEGGWKEQGRRIDSVERRLTDALAASPAFVVPEDDLRDRVESALPDCLRYGAGDGPGACYRHIGDRSDPCLPCSIRAALAAPPAPVASRPEAVVKAEALREAAGEVRSRFEHSLLSTDECDWVSEWLGARASALVTSRPEAGGRP